MLGGPGADCDVHADCFSNYCFRPYAAIGIGPGYCSFPCNEVADCDTLYTDDYSYACLRVGTRNRCVRSCDDGAQCPNNDFCGDVTRALGTNPGITNFNGCFSLADNACGGDVDCPTGDVCYATNDYHHLVKYCGTPRNGAGAPVTVKRTGEACDPSPNEPCTTSTECPTNWTCEPVAAGGRRVCVPPVEEQCANGCTPAGYCGGFCDSDADCAGGSPVCSSNRFRALGNGTGEGFDDRDLVVGQCIAAPVTPTECSSRADCEGPDAGVDGGPVCVAALRLADGGVEPHCYQPRQFWARNGEPCGDDLSTYPDFEVRQCSGACVNGVCGEICGDAADCPSDFTCEEVLFGSSPIKACVKRRSCSGDGVDGGCQAMETCEWVNTGRSQFRSCRLIEGDLQKGDTCIPGVPPNLLTRAERCVGGCGNFRGEPRCTGACSTDSECPVDWTCLSGQFLLDNRGTTNVADDVLGPYGFCVPTPGTRTACTKPADCGAGESCTPIVRGGVSSAWCTRDIDGGAALGEECLGKSCASDLCITRPLQFNRGYCSEVCSVDGDCTTGLVCRPVRGQFVSTNGPPKLCVEAGDPRIVP